jgi:hypothetical protein
MKTRNNVEKFQFVKKASKCVHKKTVITTTLDGKKTYYAQFEPHRKSYTSRNSASKIEVE